MKSFSVTIQINASPDTLWKLLTDAKNYPAWNPTIDKVEGEIALGKSITVHAKISPGRAFPVKVAELSPTKMVWRGGMPLGLFKGERTFTVTTVSANCVEFTMTEIFSGLLAPLITKSIPDLQPAFDEFAAALKKTAE